MRNHHLSLYALFSIILLVLLVFFVSSSLSPTAAVITEGPQYHVDDHIVKQTRFVPPFPCKDSDEHSTNFLWKKGLTDGYDEKKGKRILWEDSCQSSTEVIEFYCTTDEYVQSRIEVCPTRYECYDGRCMRASRLPKKCYDTDGGIDIRRKGDVNGVLKGETGFYDDVCLDTKNIREYHCSANAYSVLFSDIECTGRHGCANGACRTS
jgi:hypothetical protein